MVVERMLELLLWNQISDNGYSLAGCDIEKINKRYKELSDEFLSDYVKEDTPKGE